MSAFRRPHREINAGKSLETWAWLKTDSRSAARAQRSTNRSLTGQARYHAFAYSAEPDLAIDVNKVSQSPQLISLITSIP
jgi:hypothetical protein